MAHPMTHLSGELGEAPPATRSRFHRVSLRPPLANPHGMSKKRGRPRRCFLNYSALLVELFLLGAGGDYEVILGPPTVLSPAIPPPAAAACAGHSKLLVSLTHSSVRSGTYVSRLGSRLNTPRSPHATSDPQPSVNSCPCPLRPSPLDCFPPAAIPRRGLWKPAGTSGAQGLRQFLTWRKRHGHPSRGV